MPRFDRTELPTYSGIMYEFVIILSYEPRISLSTRHTMS